MNHKRRKIQRSAGLSIMTLLFFVSSYFSGKPLYAQEMITVAVASSFYQQAELITHDFKKKHDVQVRLISGSTGRLYHQIKQGAPFDIWIAADAKLADSLHMKSHVIAQGYLGLKVKGNWATDLHRLQDESIQTIAIANPKVAPFGRVSKRMLEQAGLWQNIQSKLVYAQNAMQANMMVNQHLTDAGFVPSPQKDKALAMIPYVAVLLSKKSAASMYFSGLQDD